MPGRRPLVQPPSKMPSKKAPLLSRPLEPNLAPNSAGRAAQGAELGIVIVSVEQPADFAFCRSHPLGPSRRAEMLAFCRLAELPSQDVLRCDRDRLLTGPLPLQEAVEARSDLRVRGAISFMRLRARSRSAFGVVCVLIIMP